MHPLLRTYLSPPPEVFDSRDQAARYRQVRCVISDPVLGLQDLCQGRAVAQAVSRWLPTTAARVGARVQVVWDL
jgi:hypothetical protein